MKPFLRLFVLVLLCVSRTTFAQATTDEDTLDTDEPSHKQKLLPADVLAALLTRYDREPEVQSVIAATLAAARVHPQHFTDMASRSRLRGLIPHLDVGLRRGQGIDLRWTTPTADDLANNRTTADDLMLFGTLRFDLDRLLFTSEEVGIAREQRFAHDAQRELIRKVVHVYFLRRRLLLESDLLGGTSIATLIRIREAEALLDAFTDGAFQRMLRQNRSVHGKSAQAPTLPRGDSR
jgi:hypothetical protein